MKNVTFKNMKAPTDVGANVSLILGHFQKCLTASIEFSLRLMYHETEYSSSRDREKRE